VSVIMGVKCDGCEYVTEASSWRGLGANHGVVGRDQRVIEPVVECCGVFRRWCLTHNSSADPFCALCNAANERAEWGGVYPSSSVSLNHALEDFAAIAARPVKMVRVGESNDIRLPDGAAPPLPTSAPPNAIYQTSFSTYVVVDGQWVKRGELPGPSSEQSERERLGLRLHVSALERELTRLSDENARLKGRDVHGAVEVARELTDLRKENATLRTHAEKLAEGMTLERAKDVATLCCHSMVSDKELCVLNGHAAENQRLSMQFADAKASLDRLRIENQTVRNELAFYRQELRRHDPRLVDTRDKNLAKEKVR
jgi:hypothetical protein